MGVEGVSGDKGVKRELELEFQKQGYAATLKISAVRNQNTFTSAVSVDTNNTILHTVSIQSCMFTDFLCYFQRISLRNISLICTYVQYLIQYLW